MNYITLPLRFEYDADVSGDPAEFHTCQASIFDDDGRLVVEEPGPDVPWQALQEIVEAVNAPKVEFCQHLKALSDNNGNPRRIWLHYEASGTGVMIRAYDEGFTGKPRHLRGMTQLPELNVGVSEYNDLLRRYRV